MNEAGARQAGTLERAQAGTLERAGAALQRAARLVAGLMFAGVFLVFLYKIVMRYTFHEALAWGEEVSVILFIWIIFWANAFLVRDKEQITFDLVYRLFPATTQRTIALARAVIVGGIFAWALPGSLDYIGFLWREHTPVLNLPLDIVYSCFGIFLVAVIVRSTASAAKLLGPRWRGEI
jgi:TRAP-type C4-dicarboxylate transport system permease small subunit